MTSRRPCCCTLNKRILIISLLLHMFTTPKIFQPFTTVKVILDLSLTYLAKSIIEI